MNRIKKFSYIFLFVLVLSIITWSGTAYADKYATTDMTWAEFYAGETGQTSKALEDAGLDAVSSATNHTLSLFPFFPLSAATSNDAGSTISGVKDVQVVMTDEVYEALKNTRVGRNGTGIDRFTFLSAVESAFTDLY